MRLRIFLLPGMASPLVGHCVESDRGAPVYKAQVDGQNGHPGRTARGTQLDRVGAMTFAVRGNGSPPQKVIQMGRKSGAWLIVVALTGVMPAIAAGQSTGAVLRSIQVVEEDGTTLVTMDADGPLPLPTSDSLDGPPRIYFDLAGVTPGTRGTSAAPGGGPVRRVRVALHSASPIVTRVVLDLTRRETYRVDSDERQAGIVRIFVGSPLTPTPPARARHEPIPSPAAAAPTDAPPVSGAPAGTPVVPAPAVPAGSTTRAEDRTGTVAPVPPPATASPGPVRRRQFSPQVPTRPAPPAREVDLYRQQLSDALERMEARRSLVARIDADESIGAAELAFAAQEFDELRLILARFEPSAALRSTHDLLIASCSFGAMAASLRIDAAQENSPETRRNAASAAAGSLMLVELACADLGCTRTPP